MVRGSMKLPPNSLTRVQKDRKSPGCLSDPQGVLLVKKRTKNGCIAFAALGDAEQSRSLIDPGRPFSL
jgi:hypothetical protein